MHLESPSVEGFLGPAEFLDIFDRTDHYTNYVGVVAIFDSVDHSINFVGITT